MVTLAPKIGRLRAQKRAFGFGTPSALGILVEIAYGSRRKNQGIIWLLIVLLGCGESGQADDGQRLEDANLIGWNDICNLHVADGLRDVQRSPWRSAGSRSCGRRGQAWFNENDRSIEVTLLRFARPPSRAPTPTPTCSISSTKAPENSRRTPP